MSRKTIQFHHRFCFLPKSKTPDTASNIKYIPVKSTELYPSKSDSISKAYNRLQNIIDPYSARNYWELYNVISSYANPPWDTHIRLKDSIRLFSWCDSVIIERLDNRTAHIIKHDAKINESDIQKIIGTLYNCSHSKIYVDKINNTESVLNIQWETLY